MTRSQYFSGDEALTQTKGLIAAFQSAASFRIGRNMPRASSTAMSLQLLCQYPREVQAKEFVGI